VPASCAAMRSMARSYEALILSGKNTGFPNWRQDENNNFGVALSLI
jgi:hypothetical protein